MQKQPLDDRDVAPWVEVEQNHVEQNDEARAYQEEREAAYADMEAAPSEPY